MAENERIKQLEEENIKLKEKLSDFKKIEEDLIADKVFKKAKERLVSWYTIGGIAIFAAGMVGVKSIVDYSKELVSKKLETFSEAKINQIIVSESHKQVEVLLLKQQDTLTKQFQLLYDDAKKRLDLTKYGYGGTVVNDTSQSKLSNVTLPQIDLSSQMLPVRDQGSEGSNVGFTIASALEYAILQKDNLKTFISPRYIYNSINNKADGGALITDGLNFLTKTGAIAESDWPYKAGEYTKEPPPSTLNAKHYKISSWQTIKVDVNTFKKYLSDKTVIIAGMTVYESLYHSKNGVYATPKLNDKLQGGVGTCLVGYDDKKELFKFRISWGAGWGNNGYGYILYSDISKLITDAYVINL
jgi:C1A family cysteine protease